MRIYGVEMRMNKLENWFMKRIIRKMVIQSLHNDARISYLYEMIYDACRNEYFEDNIPTLESFLQECFDYAKPVPEAEQTERDIENAKGMQRAHEEWLKNGPKWEIGGKVLTFRASCDKMFTSKQKRG